MKAKKEKLKRYILDKERVAIALSGGLDSSILLAYAVSILGAENCLALTASTPYMMGQEMEEARSFAGKLGVGHTFLKLPIPEELENNPAKRCYLCKKNLFTQLRKSAWEKGFFFLCDGSNSDDDSDYRPGMQALKELGIESPLKEAGMGKEDIRALGRELGLDSELIGKAAYACLLTRWEHEVPFTESDLRKIDAAEEFLRAKGFPGTRVRVHGDLARIEILPDQWERLLNAEWRLELVDKLKEIGYSSVTVDLQGYSRGRMNIILPNENS